MVFTVELRYTTGGSTTLSTEAATADQALDLVRDPRRELVGIRISAEQPGDGPGEPSPAYGERERPGYRRAPAHHRPSRRSR
jgi:hypothetical protein